MANPQPTFAFPETVPLERPPANPDATIDVLICRLRERGLHVVKGSWMTEDEALTPEQIRDAVAGE